MKAKVANKGKKRSLSYILSHYWQYYVLLLVPLTFLIVFHYIPIYGIQIAFKKFKISQGIIGSPWIGLKNFERFFSNSSAVTVIFNTIKLSFYSLIAGMPFPIILALSLNYLKSKRFKKSLQFISYAPHFISTVVMVGMILQIFSRNGLINNILALVGRPSINIMAMPKLFNDVYVWSGIWQNVGFSSILYVGLLSSVDFQQHEAAIVDGASIMRRMWYIDLPVLIPMVIINFIMSIGNILNVGFEKVFLLQNPTNLGVSEIISTYVYKMSFQTTLPDYAYTTAIGLFQSLIGFALLLIANRISNKVTGSGI